MPNMQDLPDRGIVRVTFELPADVHGDVVHLVGDFTGWEGTPMQKQPDGSWRTTVDLAPGSTYEFRYLVDGLRWENDWNADRYVANVFGQENSVIETPPIAAAGTAADGQARTAAQPRRAPEGSRSATGAAKTARQLAPPKGATQKTSADPAAAKKTPARKSAAKKSAATKAGGQTTRRTPAKAPRKASTSKSSAGKASGSKASTAKTAPAQKAPDTTRAAASRQRQRQPGAQAATAPKEDRLPPGMAAGDAAILDRPDRA